MNLGCLCYACAIVAAGALKVDLSRSRGSFTARRAALGSDIVDLDTGELIKPSVPVKRSWRPAVQLFETGEAASSSLERAASSMVRQTAESAELSGRFEDALSDYQRRVQGLSQDVHGVAGASTGMWKGLARSLSQGELDRLNALGDAMEVEKLDMDDDDLSPLPDADVQDKDKENHVSSGSMSV
eukprot:TRINITY_DN17285_c0_g1_i1.p1 TRINITY_DN17285_c0_g1~~TRINITY_DN17285_c0_g1_i1.p1  ORF type:complete len:185 (+),score=31.80 TRINITY_DN17285_c0_g1_i1:71-625(+)